MPKQVAAAAQATATAQREGLGARLAGAKATIEALVAKIGEGKAPPTNQHVSTTNAKMRGRRTVAIFVTSILITA